MSNSEIDSDGFQVVKSKNSAKNKHTKLPNKQNNFKKEESQVDVDKSIRRITTAIEELQESKYLKDVTKSVSTVLQDKIIVEIVCFGLGHISECNIAKHQLAFLLCVKGLCKPKKVFVHDPIFYKGECEILKRLGLNVIEENKEGTYITSEKDITLVYLPHCPKQLTNNFLWSNWGVKLQNCVLICNSFNSLVENNPSRVLQETVPYVYKIHPYTEEIILENNFRYTDIFNDTSLHYFSNEKLAAVSSDFWKKGQKPAYDNTEEFITSLMVKKLNF